MLRYVIRVYDYMASHKSVCIISCIISTLILILSLAQLQYKEDISDFLPVDGKEKEALKVYQDISGADQIFAVFQYREDSVTANPDIMVSAISSYSDLILRTDTLKWVKEFTAEVDLNKLSQSLHSIYDHIPYFLTEKDYVRMDSLLNSEDYIRRQLNVDKEMLMFPSSALIADAIAYDPLNLFTTVVNDLQSLSTTSSFETYNGCIFTPDMRQALVMMCSPFGNSETQQNTRLLSYLQSVADSVHILHPQVSVRYVGGPVIAVENARQIKNDSLWSVSMAVVLILILLGYSLKKISHLLLIAISIAWGWIFAMGMLSFLHDDISLIVVGISSIILGIAINYPLHLIAHLSATPDVRSALREVASPLIIGNITTVGAFLALVPLDAVALRDLGLFSTFLLLGTILFVILYLPHVVRSHHKTLIKTGNEKHLPFQRLSQFSIEGKRWVLPLIIVLTFVLGFYSTSTHFDANMANINYMSDEQRHDLQYFQKLATADSSNLQSVYVVSKGSTLDEALTIHGFIQDSLKAYLEHESGEKMISCGRFYTSKVEQEKRVSLWNDFVMRNHSVLVDHFLKQSEEEGFVADAFSPYLSIIEGTYANELPMSAHPLNALLPQYLSIDSLTSSFQIVDKLKLNSNRLEDLNKLICSLGSKEYTQLSKSSTCYSFDIPSMNSALANHLSVNFNYIGWACGIIVFLFLWFSFGKMELAMLSFLPMAISWVWILGLMGFFDIHFNIVNIILATFIFGQGDDYTIFIAEGCCYEYAYRKKLLASYKSSIIISALIMFIGIGTLIFAKHPALYSLAEVTIIGMFSVVLMAFTLPPIVFNWMVKQNGNYRRRPLTLTGVARTWYCGIWWLFQLSVGYFIGFLLAILGKANPLRQSFLNKFVCWAHRLDQHLIPGVSYTLRNACGENFSKPSVIVCNHQSMLDPMCLMALSHKILIVANMHSSHNPVIRYMFRWLGFYTIDQNNFKAWQDSSLQRDIDIFKAYVKKGYSIAVFPEGVRNSTSSILRYHKGAFYLAHELGVDILPIIIHGMNNIMPLHSFMTHSGKLTVSIESRIKPNSALWGITYQETTKLVHRYFVERYNEMCRELENTSYFKNLVLDRYMYKGADVYRKVKSNLSKFHNYASWVDQLDKSVLTVYVMNSQLGDFTLMLALVNPSVQIIGIESDEEQRLLATYSAEGLVSNLSYIENNDNFEQSTSDSTVIVYNTLNF